MKSVTTSIESQVSRTPAAADWRRQFTRPTGRLGRLVGHLMAVKNRARNDATFVASRSRANSRIIWRTFASDKCERGK